MFEDILNFSICTNQLKTLDNRWSETVPPDTRLAIGGIAVAGKLKKSSFVTQVANPSVDTAARNRGVVLPPAFDEEWEQNVGFVPGPHDKLRWSMDINRIPIRDEKHAHFAKLRGHDMK